MRPETDPNILQHTIVKVTAGGCENPSGGLKLLLASEVELPTIQIRDLATGLFYDDAPRRMVSDFLAVMRVRRQAQIECGLCSRHRSILDLTVHSQRSAGCNGRESLFLTCAIPMVDAFNPTQLLRCVGVQKHVAERPHPRRAFQHLLIHRVPPRATFHLFHCSRRRRVRTYVPFQIAVDR